MTLCDHIKVDFVYITFTLPTRNIYMGISTVNQNWVNKIFVF